MGIEHVVGEARDRRVDDVADRQALGAETLGLLERGLGVGGLARLGDRQDQIALTDDRLAVAKLAGQIDLDGDPRELLDEVLAGQRRVPRGPAGDHRDLVPIGQGREVDGREIGEVERVAVGRARARQPAAERVADRPRLLEDLLEHEVLEALLLGRERAPLDASFATASGLTFAVEQGHDPGRIEEHDVAVIEVDDRASVLEDRGHIRGHEGLVELGLTLRATEADQQRRRVAGSDDLVGVFVVDHGHGVGPLELGEAGPNRGE